MNRLNLILYTVLIIALLRCGVHNGLRIIGNEEPGQDAYREEYHPPPLERCGLK